MAPRLHAHAHPDLAEDQTTAAVPVYYANEVELALLFDVLGVNELAGVAGAEDRTVQLSPRSEVTCPAHNLTLKPDACRSCWFLDPTRPPT